MNFVAIDFETANNSRTSACAIGMVSVRDGAIVASAVRLIRPPSQEFLFTYIHGIRWADVARERHFGDVWAELSPMLQGADFIAAHNAGFDKGVLNACCGAYGLTAPALPYQCTVQIARRAFKIFPTKLSNVCERLGIELNHHEALSDAMACAQIVIAAASREATANQPAVRRPE